MTDLEYIDKQIDCTCGQILRGTYIKRMGYIFTCNRCDKTYRGGFWLRLVLWGFFQNYENYSYLRKFLNNKIKFIFSKLGLC